MRLLPSRRAFLAGSAGAVGAAVLGPEALIGSGASAPAFAANGAPQPSRGTASDQLQGFIAAGEVADHERFLSSITPCFTGSAAHKRFLDWAQGQLEQAGLAVQRRTLRFDYQELRSWGVNLNGRDPGPIGVWPYSGTTGPGGVTAPLYYAGSSTSPDLGGAAGKIVLIDFSLLTQPVVDSYIVRDIYPPSEIDAWGQAQHPDVVATFQGPPNNAAIQAAGAVGLIAMWPGVTDESAAYQNAPFTARPVGLPGVWVGAGNRAKLLAAARAGQSATLVLDEPLHPGTSTDNLWTVVPGATDEVIIVNTHTDGCNAVEENGLIGVVALARYFARRQNRRTMVFVGTTGHFGHGLVPGTATFIAEQSDLVSRAVACVTIEHLGATEWVDHPYRPTGKNQWMWVYTPYAPGANVFAEAVGGTGALRAMAVDPKALYFGEGHPFFNAGVPTISWLSGPTYLFTSPPGGEIGKVNLDNMYGELITLARCVTTLDGMSAASIKAFPGPAS